MPWTAGTPPVLPPVPGTPGPPTPAAASDTPWYLQAVQATLAEYGIWLVIIAVALIGLWGLLAPGGGVAVIERAAA